MRNRAAARVPSVSSDVAGRKQCVIVLDSAEGTGDGDTGDFLHLEAGAGDLSQMTEGRHLHLDEILPRETRRRAADTALECLHRFVRTVEACGSFDGIPWARLFLGDRELFFFREVCLGVELASLFRGQYDEVLVQPSERHRVFEGVLCASNENCSRLEGMRPEPTSAGLNDSLMRLADATRRKAARCRSLRDKIDPCKIAAVFSASQWERFTDPLLELQERYGKDFQFWYLGSMNAVLRKWARSHGMETRFIPYPLRVDPEVRHFAAAAWARWQEQGERELEACLGSDCLGKEPLLSWFRQFFLYTLPRAIQWGRSLDQALCAASPDCLLGTAANTYMSRLPYLVGHARGIPSVALSHTYVPGDFGTVEGDYLMCRDCFERDNYRQSFPDNSRVLFCRNGRNRVTYAPDRNLDMPDFEGKIVAVLTASPSIGDSLLTAVDPGRFAMTLRELASPPADLPEVHMVLKSHPRYDVSPWLSPEWGGPRASVWPASAPLAQLLEKAWAVIVCEHYGGVVAEALGTGRPVVFLDTAGFYYPRISRSGFEGGEMVEDIGSLWGLLRKIKDSDDRYQELASRSSTFAKRHLQPGELSLSQQVERILSSGVVDGE